ncbi:MAG: ABC transporter ATP-binding protein [Betaproteobacteria bacterium]|nr:ABC transporter ATP-binding protein [Betaproteobacteria bacterium]
MSAEVLLQVRGLQTVLDTAAGTVRAVDGLSFDIRRGETFALLGESGCGKSMAALSITRLLPDVGRIVGGSVHLQGRDLLALPESAMRDVRGVRIGMIFQEPGTSLNPVMTVGDQIVEALACHDNLDRATRCGRAIELLDAVGIPDSSRRVHEYPFQLSGGMKQRVMIATALASGPGLLLADEPTTALDVTIQAQVLELLRELQRANDMAILLITHDLGVVAESAHRVGVMYAGHVVESARREEFFREPLHPYSQKLFAALPARGKRGAGLAVIRGGVPSLTRRFTGCRFAERCERAWHRCHEVAPDWHELAEGRGVRCHLYDAPVQRGEPTAQPGHQSSTFTGSVQVEGDTTPAASSVLLSVADLKIHFPVREGLLRRVKGHVKAVDGVSLGIAAGRTLALVGESGCGKTTVARGILRLVTTTAGRVDFGGVDLLELDPSAMRAHRRELQIIFQDPYASLNPRMRVGEIVEEGMVSLGAGRNAQDRRARMDELLRQVGLAPDMRDRYPHEFSGGQRQRIAIARALAVEPRVVICDEPTSALDVSVQAQILNLLRDLQSRLGLAYLFITHNVSVVEFLAHEVAVMYLGRIVEHGTVEEVLGSPRHPYTQALLSSVPSVEAGTRREAIRLRGELPSPARPPEGCHFHPRCPQAKEICRQRYPAETSLSRTHRVRCHLYPM